MHALCDPKDCSPPGSSVHETSQQEYCSGLPFPPSGDLPDPGVEPESPALIGVFFTAESLGYTPQQHLKAFNMQRFFFLSAKPLCQNSAKNILAMGFPVGSAVKSPPAKEEMQFQSLGQKDPLEKEMATPSSILAWEIPRTEELGGIQSMVVQLDTNN